MQAKSLRLSGIRFPRISKLVVVEIFERLSVAGDSPVADQKNNNGRLMDDQEKCECIVNRDRMDLDGQI